MQRDGAVALTSDEVQQKRTYRLLSDEDVIWALLVHPGTSVSTLARLFHLPGSAVDWHALKSQLHRLAADRRLKAIVNGKRRKWIGWEVTP
jgi:hypothetical protein